MKPSAGAALPPAEAARPAWRNRVLEPDLLKAFVAVVDYGGYTAASKALHRSQAAVSQQIRRLEETVQVALFQHPRHAIQVTPQGTILLEYARRLLALNDEALASVLQGGVSGKVRIGANNYFATRVLPPLLAEFCKSHPEVQIEMHTGVASEMQRQLGTTFDLLINLHPAGSRNGHLLRRAPLQWLTSRVESPHLRDPLPLGLLPRGSLIRDLAITALASAGRPWHLAQESLQDAALEASAAAGLAVIVSSIPAPDLRVLTEADGLPSLPQVEARLETAERYLPNAAERLHAFLLDRLAVPES